MKTVLFGIMFVMLLTQNGFSQDPKDLAVSLNKDSFSRDEKVTVTIKNVSNKSVWVRKACSSLATGILKKNAEEWQSYHANPVKLCESFYPEVKSGETIQDKVSFDWFEHRYFKVEPGVYKFQLAYSIVTPNVEGSEPLFLNAYSEEFNVTNPNIVTKERALSIAQELIETNKIDMSKNKFCGAQLVEREKLPKSWVVMYCPVTQQRASRIIVWINSDTGEAHISPDD